MASNPLMIRFWKVHLIGPLYKSNDIRNILQTIFFREITLHKFAYSHKIPSKIEIVHKVSGTTF